MGNDDLKCAQGILAAVVAHKPTRQLRTGQLRLFVGAAREQKLCHLRRGGEHDGNHVQAGLLVVDVSAIGQQQLDHFLAFFELAGTAKNGEAESFVLCFSANIVRLLIVPYDQTQRLEVAAHGHCIHVGAARHGQVDQQQTGDVGMVASGCFRESGLAMAVGCEYVGAVIEENFRCSPTAIRSCEDERRNAQGSVEIHFGAAGEEQLCYFGGIANGRAVQGGKPCVRTLVLCSVHAGTVFNEKSRDRYLVLFGGVVQERLVCARTIIDIDARRGEILLQSFERAALPELREVRGSSGALGTLQVGLRGNDRGRRNHVGESQGAPVLIADLDYFGHSDIGIRQRMTLGLYPFVENLRATKDGFGLAGGFVLRRRERCRSQGRVRRRGGSLRKRDR
jgi:hypothetical protein